MIILYFATLFILFLNFNLYSIYLLSYISHNIADNLFIYFFIFIISFLKELKKNLSILYLIISKSAKL